MRQTEKNLIDILICDLRGGYDFPHDRRLVNYMYSTWNRYDLCIRILQREDFFDPYLLRSELRYPTDKLIIVWATHCGRL